MTPDQNRELGRSVYDRERMNRLITRFVEAAKEEGANLAETEDAARYIQVSAHEMMEERARAVMEARRRDEGARAFSDAQARARRARFTIV